LISISGEIFWPPLYEFKGYFNRNYIFSVGIKKVEVIVCTFIFIFFWRKQKNLFCQHQQLINDTSFLIYFLKIIQWALSVSFSLFKIEKHNNSWDVFFFLPFFFSPDDSEILYTPHFEISSVMASTSVKGHYKWYMKVGWGLNDTLYIYLVQYFFFIYQFCVKI
jgi:hypothetical protein